MITLYTCVCKIYLKIWLQFPLNKLTDQIRVELAHAGFTEALTFSLVYFNNAFNSYIFNILRIFHTILFYSVHVKM